MPVSIGVRGAGEAKSIPTSCTRRIGKSLGGSWTDNGPEQGGRLLGIGFFLGSLVLFQAHGRRDLDLWLFDLNAPPCRLDGDFRASTRKLQELSAYNAIL